MVFGQILNLATTLSLSCYQHPLNCVNRTSTAFPPPIIQYGHQNQTLMLNDMAILPCQATGRVPVQISWLKNGKVLDFNTTRGRYRQLPVGTLQITDLTKEDTGVYTCRATNEDGEATWTASLIAAEHTNQDTIFHRMPDASALPSSPGQPKLLNVTETTIELEWTTPERHGTSPIIGYILQYWSAELGEYWRNILDVVPKTRFLVNDMQAGHSYIFVVRAENSKGIGLPSPMSELITTKKLPEWDEGTERRQKMNRLLDLETARQRLAAEQLVKLLEVRAMNSTAVLLSWKRQKNEPLVQGYYIKWRGPPLAHDHSWINITQPETDHVLINGLKPFNNYEFFVIPYHNQVQGMPSNSIDGTTAEAPPEKPPSDVRMRMLNISSLRVSWRPPPADAINGILKGFIINIKSNHSSVEDRNITTNERATSVTLYRLIPNASYAIRVAARTNAGVGIFYNGEPIVMNDETLQQHIRFYERSDNTWYRQPWSVLACGVVLWCLFLLAMVFFWYHCCHKKENENGSKKRQFIKINDGSVANTTMNGDASNNTFWGTHERYNGETVETTSGTLARVGQQQHLAFYQHPVDHVFVNCTNRKELINDLPIRGNLVAIPSQTEVFGNPSSFIAATTFHQHNDGEAANPSANSPHYHYAQLPPNDQFPEHNSLSTFLQQKPIAGHYDDPSPYATTTLVTPTGVIAQTLRKAKGPALPLKPVPKDPPRNFLSSAAVVQLTNNNQRNIGYLKELEQPNSNSCSALLELNEECGRITAVERNKGLHRRNRPQQSLQHAENRTQQYRTNERVARSGECRRSARSSSANTTGKETAFCSLRRISHHKQNQQESPQSEISYLQSSDGTIGSKKIDRIIVTQVIHQDAAEYDPVMTDSLNQMLQSNLKRRKDLERTNRRRMRNRISLIEDERQEEEDPLMENDCEFGMDDLEADEEMSDDGQQQSDEYVSGGVERKTRKSEHHYLEFSRPSNNANRQPMMGVNISTLSANAEKRSSTPSIL